MKKLKSSDDTLDRLSELPDSLILEILSLLEMRDVVRTTLLSKRWKYLWITIPCLQFSEFEKNPVQIRNFVSRALKLWRGTHLRKFSIDFFRVIKGWSLYSEIDLWVLFAIEMNVEELCIELYSVEKYCPPQCLYGCSSIRKLLLRGCCLKIRGIVKWDRLNSLELFDSFYYDVINHVFSSSPQLETFTSFYCSGFENLSIRSSSLKKLLIWSTSESDMLTIQAPNLEAMEIGGRPCTEYLLTDVSSLSELYLGFFDTTFSGMCKILPVIQQVTTVRLSQGCLQMLGCMKRRNLFSPLLNVEVLRIDRGLTKLRDLIGLLEIFSELKVFIVEDAFELNADNCIMSEANILKSNLVQLRIVKITWYSYKDSIFDFIEFLLNFATGVEKVLIRNNRRRVVDDSKDMFLAAQKVEILQRSFPGVELILCRK